jgi:hypothetical protein
MTRPAPLRSRALSAATSARPAFEPIAISRERWLNPESPGTMLFKRISLPAISMHIAALAEES